ncbi:MAG: hypothetical protein HOV81_29820 [Kofleriaceae bacterium]|nr:hypothetical protein [Kofleriaceae bacterium]
MTLDERDKDSSWQPVLSLEPFFLHGDAISNYLFGLAKDPYPRPLFGYRGIPTDCTDVVRAAYKENQRFYRKYRDGWFGHTHAEWGEICAALARPEAPELDQQLGGWPAVIDTTTVLGSRLCSQPSSQLRIVVWASW